MFHPSCISDLALNLSLETCAGGRDRRGGPVLTFPARSNHDRIRAEDLRRLVAYLATIPRQETHKAFVPTPGRQEQSKKHLQ